MEEISKEKAIERLIPDNNVTEEEFQNFMHRVTEVHDIVKQLASENAEEQHHGEILADEILYGKEKKEFSEMGEIVVKTNRTIINKCRTAEEESADPSQMSQAAFMGSVERDAKERANDRKIRNERAEIFKIVANAAFKTEDYEKAITYYTKAVEQRKDSALLWNNRAICYMKLGLYQKALNDCEWALKVNNTNTKALLNSAKCHRRLLNLQKSEEFFDRAKELNPHLAQFIDELVTKMNAEIEDDVGKVFEDH